MLTLTLVRHCEETGEALIQAHRVVIFAIAQLSCYYYYDTAFLRCIELRL